VNVLPTWFIWLAAGLTGAAIGSFLNVCVSRWPREESVIRPPSRCPACEHPLAWRDNIPVAGWLLLRGRCRYCGIGISAQYPVVEAATALIWIAAVAQSGPGLEALRTALFLTVLLGIALTDAKEMVIPDQFTLLGAAAGLALAAAPSTAITLRAAILGAGAGYVLLWAVKLGAEKLLQKPALGVGDIHMMLLVGAFTGIPGMLLTLMLGSILGLVLGVPFTWLRGRLAVLGSYLPLGTFLAMGGAIAYVWGAAIIGWYLDLIGV
jgi:leader peptidase (prepilin peptidase) / N-methyltransferase